MSDQSNTYDDTDFEDEFDDDIDDFEEIEG
jgi:hypothetical protein